MEKRKICILKPRLDMPFKDFGANPAIDQPEDLRNIPPIRKHWNNFVNSLRKAHREMMEEVEIINQPLYTFTKAFVKKIAKEYDVVYMPHKQKLDFDVGSNVLYYHQTVFPEYFTINKMGWGATMDVFPLDISKTKLFDSMKTWTELQKRLVNNVSKFAQPNQGNYSATNFNVFVCQIPHDETIKYHSGVTVEYALKKTIEYCKANNENLVVKGHPVNIAAMEPLKVIAQEAGIAYYDLEYSIHDFLRNANKVFLVNSGSGFEAMLHNKQVIRFGDAEYNQVTSEFGNIVPHNVDDYMKFLHEFIKLTYSSTDIESFKGRI